MDNISCTAYGVKWMPGKRRQPLSRERIVEAAAVLIEKTGVPAFSMRPLAAALKVVPMALYHHFPSKAHLCDAVLDRLVAGIPPVDASLGWRERVVLEARAFRAAVRRQPAFAVFAVTHRLNTPTGLTFLNRMATLFLEGGAAPELAARQFRALGYYVAGALIDETSGYAKGPTAADPLTLAQQKELAPEVIRLGPHFAESGWDATFELGLQSLADAFVAQRAKRP